MQGIYEVCLTWGHPVPLPIEGIEGAVGQSCLEPGTGFQSLLRRRHNAPVPCWQSNTEAVRFHPAPSAEVQPALRDPQQSYDMMWHRPFLGLKKQYGRPSECSFQDAFNVVFTVSSCTAVERFDKQMSWPLRTQHI